MMRRVYQWPVMSMLMVCAALPCAWAQEARTAGNGLSQAEAVLTVAESKRLIAKGVAQMPMVRAALEKGLVSIGKGTTNSYVVEEILGKPIHRPGYTLGVVTPVQGERLTRGEHMAEVTLRDGKIVEGMGVEQAAEEFEEGDVFIKGANALDYRNKVAGVLIGAPDRGTMGKAYRYVIARKAKLIIPIGLEKGVYSDIGDLARMLNENVDSLNRVYALWPMHGHIVTEIEALKILANVDATLIAAGGIAGAEGGVRLLLRGQRAEVAKALSIIGEIQGEPPFAAAQP